MSVCSKGIFGKQCRTSLFDFEFPEEFHSLTGAFIPSLVQAATVLIRFVEFGRHPTTVQIAHCTLPVSML
jgi:hypothetical protein